MNKISNYERVIFDLSEKNGKLLQFHVQVLKGDVKRAVEMHEMLYQVIQVKKFSQLF